MNEPVICITVPMLSAGSAVLFSAYGFGWGYRAFTVSYEAVYELLGARDTTDRQIRMAFQLGKQQIIDAVLRYESPSYEGQRIPLSLESSPGHAAPEALLPTKGNRETASAQA